MQPGEKSRQFERARNSVDLGSLGDPERWGGVGQINLESNIGTTQFSNQIVRVQCPDLVARGWDLICNWQINGLDPADNIQRCGLEITIGVGQASQAVVLNLTQSIGTLIPVGAGVQLATSTAWESTIGSGGIPSGTVSLPNPIPASAMAIRGLLQIIGGGELVHPIDCSFFVAVAPRGLL